MFTRKDFNSILEIWSLRQCESHNWRCQLSGWKYGGEALGRDVVWSGCRPREMHWLQKVQIEKRGDSGTAPWEVSIF